MPRFKHVLSVLLACLFPFLPPVSSQNAPATAAKLQPLPAPNEILDRSLRATGGMAAWLKMTSLSWKADVSDDTAKFMTGKLWRSLPADAVTSVCRRSGGPARSQARAAGPDQLRRGARDVPRTNRGAGGGRGRPVDP